MPEIDAGAPPAEPLPQHPIGPSEYLLAARILEHRANARRFVIVSPEFARWMAEVCRGLAVGAL